MTFKQARIEELPKWLNGPQGQGYAGALGGAEDVEIKNLIFAVKQRSINECTDDALDVAGQGYVIERFDGELPDSYRARLQNVWATWAKAGTAQAIIDSLNAYGVEDVTVYGDAGGTVGIAPGDPHGTLPRWNAARGQWFSRFWVVLGPRMPWAPLVMPFALGSIAGALGSTAQRHEVIAVKKQILKWKGDIGYPVEVLLQFAGVPLLGPALTLPFTCPKSPPRCVWRLGKLLGSTLGHMPYRMGGYTL